jgi:magnesium chelatase family protein
MALPAPREGTAEVAARVAAVRAVQSQRFADASAPELRTNSEADGELLERVAPLEPAAGALLRRACEQMHMSARGYHRVLRVARTIADLDGAETIRKPHVAEAVGLRRVRPQAPRR